MKAFYSPKHALHNPDSFYIGGQMIPWTPDPIDRANNIFATLKGEGYTLLEAEDHGLYPIAAVHTPEYLEYLQTAWQQWQEAARAAAALGVNVSTHVYPLIFPVHGQHMRYPGSVVARAGYHAADMWMPIGQHTWEAAYAAANLAVAAAGAVLNGESAAYALCRPSGHHTYADKGGGNCYLNNAAVAAQHLRRGGLGRIAIIDIDVHHGNGTQGIFYDRDDVLFVSLHGDPDDLYPYFVGYDSERGTGRGDGYNLNLPIPLQSGDDVYMDALAVATARTAAYAPDALVVSLGVDAHEDDINSALRITLDGFNRIGARLSALGLPTVLVQEGGYNLAAIGRSVANVLESFARR